jgi:hypothetical protein
VSGVRISEHLPRIARQMHRVTLVRSMTHPFPIHCAAYALTGNPLCDIPMELNPRDHRHWPYIGSVVDYLTSRDDGQPGPRESRSTWRFPGPSAAAPARTSAPAPSAASWAAATTPSSPSSWAPRPKATVPLVTTDGYFQFTPSAQPQPEITVDRLQRRRSLLDQIDDERRRLDDSALDGFDRIPAEGALARLFREDARGAGPFPRAGSTGARSTG